MLDMFKVTAKTDGATEVSILVEPGIKKLSVMVKIDRIIKAMADETNPSFRGVGNADWQDVAFWESKARDIARAYSPFWRGA